MIVIEIRAGFTVMNLIENFFLAHSMLMNSAKKIIQTVESVTVREIFE